MRNGYEIVEPDVATTVGELTDGLEKIRKSGKHLTRAQESWVCAVQSLRRKDIPRGLYLGGATWPQDNITRKVCFMAKPLTEHGAHTLERAQSASFWRKGQTPRKASNKTNADSFLLKGPAIL